MGLSQPRPRPVRARRRRQDLLRSSSPAVAATGSSAATSACSCCLGAGGPSSTLASGASLVAAAMLDRRRSNPAIGGRVRRSPLPKPAATVPHALPTKTAVPAPPPATAAPLAGASSDLKSTPLTTNPASSASTEDVTPLQLLLSASQGLPVSWASLADWDDDDASEEELATWTPPAFGGLGSDPAVMIEGLGFLSLPPAVSGSLVSEVSFVKVVDGDEELALETSMASPNGIVSGPKEAFAEHCAGLSADAALDLGTSSAPACGILSAASAALEADEGWVHVGGRRRYNRGPPPESSKEGHERRLAFKRWARGRCFRCLEYGHQVGACRGPFRCIRCRGAGHRERFCRAPSPVAHDCSPAAHACSPVTRAPGQHHRSPFDQHCPPPEVVGHSSSPPRYPSACYKDSLVSTFESQVALLRLELLQKVELLRSEIRDALAELQVALRVSSPLQLQIVSADEGAECFFGDFSPHVLHETSPVIAEFVAPVMQVMPELQVVEPF